VAGGYLTGMLSVRADSRRPLHPVPRSLRSNARHVVQFAQSASALVLCGTMASTPTASAQQSRALDPTHAAAAAPDRIAVSTGHRTLAANKSAANPVQGLAAGLIAKAM
jgi:hypothetical protein